MAMYIFLLKDRFNKEITICVLYTNTISGENLAFFLAEVVCTSTGNLVFFMATN